MFDAHLMIEEPGRYIGEYLDAGCEAITVHIEATPEPGELLDRIREGGAAAGLALNPGTPIDRIEPYLSSCDLVLVMSVEPGFGGQSFQPVALEKLAVLREMLPPEIPLSVDGGIGPTTIGGVAAGGAREFVVGSALFDTSDYTAAIANLSQRAHEAAGSRSPRD